PVEQTPESSAAAEPRASREAAGTLLVTLSPQERAAVVLKDVFDLSLDEIAESLGTTVGAVKTALHRGRSKLAEKSVPAPAPAAATAPVPAARDAFCAASTAGDLGGLPALRLDPAGAEVVGAPPQAGPPAARRTVLTGMLSGMQILAEPGARAMFDDRFVDGVLPDPPRV